MKKFDQSPVQTIDPRDPAFYQDPYKTYALLHAASPTFLWEEFGIWCFGAYDDVNRLLRDRSLGRQSPVGVPDSRGVGSDRSHLAGFDRVEANSMLELEPPVHTRLRTLVNRAFVSRQIERLRPRVEALANELIDAFRHDEAFDLLPAYAAPLPIVIIAEMLGVPVEMAPQLLDWSHAMVKMYTPGRTREDEVAANQAAGAFADFLRGYNAQRRKQPGDDLLSLLISAQDDGQKLNEDELVSSVILLLNAGHEATVHQTGNAVATILAEAQAGRVDIPALFATPEATAATVEECLRFDAPLHMFTRYVYADTEFAPGIAVKSGDRIGLLLGMANRDPTAFSDPDAFRPGRTDQKNVSFGAGIHFCIGAPLARLELQVSLKTLFDRLPSLGTAGQPRFRDSWHFHGLERLEVKQMTRSDASSTIAFYAREATVYASRDRQIDQVSLERFLALIPHGGRILELGCGSGQDSHAMLQRGYDVIATDGTPELALEAEKLLGRSVRVLRFEDLDYCSEFDGVWAQASLLHAPKESLPRIFVKVVAALRPQGALFASFKTGMKENVDRFGRYFNNPDEPFLRCALGKGWQSIEIVHQKGSGYDRMPTDWIGVFAVKA